MNTNISLQRSIRPFYAYQFAFVLVAVASMSQAMTSEELLDLIDAGQKENMSLISPFNGQASIKQTSTPDGMRKEVEELKAFGADPPEGPFNETVTTFSTNSIVAADDKKMKWGDNKRKFMFDGKIAYEFAPGNNLPHVYIIDPKKLTVQQGQYDPRCWTMFKSNATLKDWLSIIKEEYEGQVNEITKDSATCYEIVMNYANGFTRKMLVEPVKGYNITEMTLKDNNGQLRSHLKIELTKSPGGGWLPIKRRIDFYGVVKEGQPAVLLNSEEFNLKKFEFGPLDKEEFTLMGLGVPDGTLVMDLLRDVEYVYGVSTVVNNDILDLVDNSDIEDVLEAQGTGNNIKFNNPEVSSSKKEDSAETEEHSSPGENEKSLSNISAGENEKSLSNTTLNQTKTAGNTNTIYIFVIVLLLTILATISIFLMTKKKQQS